MNETKRKQKGLSTFLWMLITLTLIVLVPLTLFILYQISLTRSIVMEERRNHLHTISHYLARELDGYISDSMDEVAILAGISEVQTYLADKERMPQEPEMLGFLEKFRRIGGYNAAYLMDNDGECVASTSPNFVGKDYSFRPYFKNAAAGGRYFYMAVGREMKMMELKQRVNSLREKCGESPLYDIPTAETETKGSRDDE